MTEDLEKYVEEIEADGLLSAPPWLKREILEAAKERERSFGLYAAEVILAMAASLLLLFLPLRARDPGLFREDREAVFFPRAELSPEDASGIYGDASGIAAESGKTRDGGDSVTALLDEGVTQVCGTIRRFSGVVFRDGND